MDKCNREFAIALFVSLIIGALAACATVGSFDTQWAYSMAVNTGIRTASTEATTKRTITKAEAQQVLTLNDQARAILDQAEKNRRTNSQMAGSQLELASEVLNAVKDFLEKRQVKVPVQVPTRKEKKS